MSTIKGHDCEAAAVREDTISIDVPSQSDPKLTYRVHAQNGVVTCNCRGYQSHSHCKHQEAVRLLMEEKTQ
jgi:hypothetical protein